jgi:hypothetical protein
MPAIIAALVMSTGRMRARAASMAVTDGEPTAKARLLGKRHEQKKCIRDSDRRRPMISAPMNDCTLRGGRCEPPG